MKESIKKVLDIADKTYYNWKKEQRPIISLIEKYFTKEELEEFLKTGKVERLDVISGCSTNELKTLLANSHNETILAQIEELKRQLL